MNNKVIGIVGWVMGNGFGITLPYMEFFSHFGNVRVLSPNDKEVHELDLLVLPGGPDVDVTRYLSADDKISMYVEKPCPFREWFDITMLPEYMKKRTPIFGICRGHQSLAVVNEGTLIQHMYHETNPSNDRSKKVHDLTINNSALSKFGLNQITDFKYSVNSLHHQVVDIIPENAISLATFKGLNISEKEKVNEALGYKDYPAFSVQWHPEELGDCRLANQMIEKLLDEDYIENFDNITAEFFEEKIMP